ncbi:hypothetical protein ACFQ07_01685, partial [Actinomadura adrarensis]
PRIAQARAAGYVREPVLWSWLPVTAGLTPHELRHSQRVWLDEDGIPDILKHDRLGHSMPGMGGTYGHVSPAMRQQVKDAMQQRWETALDQRLAISPTSSVPLLNELLAARSSSMTPKESHGHLPIVSRTPESPSPNGSHGVPVG